MDKNKVRNLLAFEQIFFALSCVTLVLFINQAGLSEESLIEARVSSL